MYTVKSKLAVFSSVMGKVVHIVSTNWLHCSIEWDILYVHCVLSDGTQGIAFPRRQSEEMNIFNYFSSRNRTHNPSRLQSHTCAPVPRLASTFKLNILNNSMRKIRLVVLLKRVNLKYRYVIKILGGLAIILFIFFYKNRAKKLFKY